MKFADVGWRFAAVVFSLTLHMGLWAGLANKQLSTALDESETPVISQVRIAFSTKAGTKTGAQAQAKTKAQAKAQIETPVEAQAQIQTAAGICSAGQAEPQATGSLYGKIACKD